MAVLPLALLLFPLLGAAAVGCTRSPILPACLLGAAAATAGAAAAVAVLAVTAVLLFGCKLLPMKASAALSSSNRFRCCARRLSAMLAHSSSTNCKQQQQRQQATLVRPKFAVVTASAPHVTCTGCWSFAVMSGTSLGMHKNPKVAKPTSTCSPLAQCAGSQQGATHAQSQYSTVQCGMQGKKHASYSSQPPALVGWC